MNIVLMEFEFNSSFAIAILLLFAIAQVLLKTQLAVVTASSSEAQRSST